MKYNSDFILLYDAKDCNPNGNPLSGDNKPRRDSSTGLAEVSSGRVKRYIRDQLFDEGYPIFVLTEDQYESDSVMTPDERAERFLEDREVEDESEAFKEFVNELVDIRFFGSAFALEELDMHSITGPVQIQPGRSLHKTKLNKELSNITGSLSTGDGSGGSMGTDYRLHYALFSVCGTINSSVGKNINFQESDAELLDTITWKSLIHQTHSNSKSGQKPRLYLRVKYDTEFYQIRNLDEYIELESEKSEQDIRSLSDCTLHIDTLVSKLESNKDKIDRVRFIEDELVDIEFEGESVTLESALEQAGVDTEQIKPYGE